MTNDDHVSPRGSIFSVDIDRTFEDTAQDKFSVFLIDECTGTKCKAFRIALDVPLVDKISMFIDPEVAGSYLREPLVGAVSRQELSEVC